MSINKQLERLSEEPPPPVPVRVHGPTDGAKSYDEMIRRLQQPRTEGEERSYRIRRKP